VNKSNFISTPEFARLIFEKIKRFRYIIIISGIICAVLLGLYAKNSPVFYTSKATIFSLSSTNDNTTTSSAISLLLGTEANKSFSEETSINIVELAQSRAIREAVAGMQVPSMGNKLIASLLIDDYNNHRSLMEPKIKAPQNKEELITVAASLLNDGLSPSINKNNSFILNYTGRSEEIVKVISYGFIEKISQFYVDIKREKAKRDYEFATNKADSLRRVLGAKDHRLIAIDRRTLFTNTEKMEFRVPTENLIEDKQLIRNQYSQAVINQQTAAYKLQKDTPLIRVLDKPDPPYDKKRKSTILYSILGFLTGSVITGALVISGLLLRFIKQETARALFGSMPSGTSAGTTTTTASAL
jgi:hypothetical protein